jgi:hypothetical protein
MSGVGAVDRVGHVGEVHDGLLCFGSGQQQGQLLGEKSLLPLGISFSGQGYGLLVRVAKAMEQVGQPREGVVHAVGETQPSTNTFAVSV